MHAVLFLGVVLLLISFFPIKRLVESLPEGPLRKRWSDLRALILFFIAGYASFIYFYWQEQDDRLELLIVNRMMLSWRSRHASHGGSETPLLALDDQSPIPKDLSRSSMLW